eukprot:CAMPEP_0178598826 /NCGR_PEP_ID=MMETSP0697-20121206/32977_1 /TAXON_ID=265572 /ORGANISM="Extubocellulus spinifer, Strain CCMP396" /LENGTH=39 /DNA_ID= /DNA_START= /DNA_END= /DNA_ORIENTATION=
MSPRDEGIDLGVVPKLDAPTVRAVQFSPRRLNPPGKPFR